MAGRGKKDCPNCNTELGGRTLLCSCGYHFLSKKMRPDLLEEKKVEGSRVKDGAMACKKICPNCKIIISANSHLCDCGHHFPSGEMRPDL